MSASTQNLTGKLSPRSMLHGRYFIVGRVGQGGMGAVYEAVDTSTHPNWRVAIKEMSQSQLYDRAEIERAKRRFRGEAGMLRALDHPNLPHVYDFFEEDERSYLVMEFIVGQNLLQLLRSYGRPLPTDFILGYAYQLSDVLAYLHRQYPPIIFRDLKPANVMVTTEGHVYLIDFGIARFFKPGQQSDTEHFGSLAYLAPQQLDRQQSNVRSDLYSLGATLHHCLTGKVPSYAQNGYRYPDVRDLNPYVPEKFARVVKSLVEREEDLRPKSAEEVRQILTEAIKESEEFTRTLARQEQIILPGDASGASPNDETGGKPVTPPELWPDWMMAFEEVAKRFFGWCSTILWPSTSMTMRGLLTLCSALLVAIWQLIKSRKLPKVSLDDVKRGCAQMGHALAVGYENSKLLVTSWSSPVLTPNFVGLLLLRLALLIVLSTYMLRVFHSYDIVAFGLSLLLFFVTSSASINTKIRDPIARSLLFCTAFTMLLTSIALIGTIDMQQVMQGVTFSQLLLVVLMTTGIIALVRTTNRLVWTDYVTMVLVTSTCALLQFTLGSQEFQQIPGLTGGIGILLSNGLTLLLALFSFIFLLRAGGSFAGFDRFMLLVIAIIYAFLQFSVGLDELQRISPFTNMFSSSNSLLNAAYVHVLLIVLPLLSAVVALFIGYRFPYASRIAVFLLAMACAFMQIVLAGNVEISLPSSSMYPLVTRVVDLFTLNQIFTYGGLIAAGILLLIRLAYPILWLERLAILIVAVACALLQSAFWSEKVLKVQISSNSAASSLFKQYFVVAANQLLADALLLLVIMAAGIPMAIALVRLTRQNAWLSRKAASVECRFTWVQGMVKILFRITFFGITLISALLILFFGDQSLFLSQSLIVSGISVALDTIVLAILAILTFVAQFRIARSFNWWDCTTLIADVAACELLAYGNTRVQKVSPPLFSSLQQFIASLLQGNIPGLLLFVGLVTTAVISLLWLRRIPFRPRLDAALFLLLAVLFGGALICILLHYIWPVLLLAALLMLIHGIFAAVQMERVRA